MLDDFDLVLTQARAGSAEAFERIYRDLARPVAAYVRGGGVRDVDDVVSEVFLAVFTGLDRFTGDQGQFRSWVFTIAHRRLVDGWRRTSRTAVHVPYEQDDDHRTTPAAEDGALTALGQDRVLALLETLTDATPAVGLDWVRGRLHPPTVAPRDVLVLRVVADLTVDQVAAVLGKRPGAVKALQRRGLATLREALSKEGVTL